MAAISDLNALLRALDPVLDPEPYAFVELSDDDPRTGVAVAIVREAEGLGGIVPLASAHDPEGSAAFVAARITLQVHSDLAAVGLTATVATALAERDVPCNVVAGLRHDHLFVPWDARERALRALIALIPSD